MHVFCNNHLINIPSIINKREGRTCRKHTIRIIVLVPDYSVGFHSQAINTQNQPYFPFGTEATCMSIIFWEYTRIGNVRFKNMYFSQVVRHKLQFYGFDKKLKLENYDPKKYVMFRRKFVFHTNDYFPKTPRTEYVWRYRGTGIHRASKDTLDSHRQGW